MHTEEDHGGAHPLHKAIGIFAGSEQRDRRSQHRLQINEGAYYGRIDEAERPCVEQVCHERDHHNNEGH